MAAAIQSTQTPGNWQDHQVDIVAEYQYFTGMDLDDALATPTNLFDIDEDEYAPYPSFSPTQPRTLPLALNDPFDDPQGPIGFSLSATAESLHISQGQGSPQSSPFASSRTSMFGTSQFQSSPFGPAIPASQDILAEEPAPASPSVCSVCGLAPSSLAVLDPCSHVLCSACLTSALNIVGEKDMECAVCKAGVSNFMLRSTSSSQGSSPSGPRGGFGTIGGEAGRAGTPTGAARRQAAVSSGRAGETPVLRIDNVPWDITPPAIRTWLKHPVKRVHVLLDRKGKTLSHAYAEMADEDAARAALRTAQNSVLGKGRRARGVTVTRSGQAELMRALFPAWRGGFEGPGGQPTVRRAGREGVGALIEEGEVRVLGHLIRSPDSHFLKVPTLPYHSLISILAKFPAETDPRVFWSATTRDALFDLTMTAIQALMSNRALANEPDLVMQLLQVALHCEAFTKDQGAHIVEIFDLPDYVQSRSPASSGSSRSSRLQTPDSSIVGMNPYSAGGVYAVPQVQSQHGPGPFDMLAREFGIDSQLVEALAQRISGMV
ncbi:hypothetical protein EWM64_g7067 [Hericium alpestre]|uniref:RING-type domain-containing protein n=1 Tax=Hericium alpestre TaxID=135208 RepID=A0A4Y9ZPW8_9AGAM|nr:hypothetical protein EWM64_g7067 [Hericium alpestre]